MRQKCALVHPVAWSRITAYRVWSGIRHGDVFRHAEARTCRRPSLSSDRSGNAHLMLTQSSAPAGTVVDDDVATPGPSFATDGLCLRAYGGATQVGPGQPFSRILKVITVRQRSTSMCRACVQATFATKNTNGVWKECDGVASAKPSVEADASGLMSSGCRRNREGKRRTDSFFRCDLNRAAHRAYAVVYD